jgi:hypothetical protein
VRAYAMRHRRHAAWIVYPVLVSLLVGLAQSIA